MVAVAMVFEEIRARAEELGGIAATVAAASSSWSEFSAGMEALGFPLAALKQHGY